VADTGQLFAIPIGLVGDPAHKGVMIDAQIMIETKSEVK
jgi:hypothetical protein